MQFIFQCHANISVFQVDIDHGFGCSQRKSDAARYADVACADVLLLCGIVEFEIRVGITCAQSPPHAVNVSVAIGSVDVFGTQREFLSIDQRVGFAVIACFGKFLQRIAILILF